MNRMPRKMKMCERIICDQGPAFNNGLNKIYILIMILTQQVCRFFLIFLQQCYTAIIERMCGCNFRVNELQTMLFKRSILKKVKSQQGDVWQNKYRDGIPEVLVQQCAIHLRPYPWIQLQEQTVLPAAK